MNNGEKSHIRDILFHLKNDDRLTHEEQGALRTLDNIWLNELISIENLYYQALRRQESDRPRNELAAEFLKSILVPDDGYAVNVFGLGSDERGRVDSASAQAIDATKGCLRLADMFLKLSGQKDTYPEPPEDNEQNR